jgi:hypothetical protein
MLSKEGPLLKVSDNELGRAGDDVGGTEQDRGPVTGSSKGERGRDACDMVPRARITIADCLEIPWSPRVTTLRGIGRPLPLVMNHDSHGHEQFLGVPKGG